MKFKPRFTIVICDSVKRKRQWQNRVDSVYLASDETLTRCFINEIIETIELKGMICIDFSDVRCVFCNMSITLFSLGRSTNEVGAVEAIRAALLHKITYADTMLVVISGNISLDHFEAVMNYLDEHMREECCVVCSVKWDSGNSNKITVALYANYKDKRICYE